MRSTDPISLNSFHILKATLPMLHPPLFLELTIYQSGAKEMILLSQIHGFSRDESDEATAIKTFVEGGMVIPWIVKERPLEIMRKALLVTKSFLLLQVQSAKEVQDKEEWNDDENGDDDIRLYA